MYFSIHFYDYISGMAIKIDDIPGYNLLTPEVKPVKFIPTQKIP